MITHGGGKTLTARSLVEQPDAKVAAEGRPDPVCGQVRADW